jgi:sugar lactone lactonase YvrE
MKRAGLLVVPFFLACTSAAPPPAPATTSPVVVDEKTQATITQITQILEKQPTHMPLIYVLATYHGRAGQADQVVRWLTRLDELGWEQGVNPIDFRTIDTPAVRAISAKLDQREPRVNEATRAFTLTNRRDLVPEGIAYDPVDDLFYVSGIHRRNVLRVTRAGAATDFVTEAQDGTLGGLGVQVDAKRRLLWVISSTTPEMRGYVAGQDASMLAAYDLRDGRLVKKITATPAILNDLTLLDDGSLFATDMGRHKVMRLAPDANTLEEWAGDFSFPNGIAVSDDNRILYVADFRGITRFDLTDRSSRKLLETPRILSGIDGLSFHRGSLIGIQNAIGKPRVVRLHLEDNRVDILEAKNAAFELPTTGVVAGSDYWFIANPGLRLFNVADPIMLRLPLRD